LIGGSKNHRTINMLKIFKKLKTEGSYDSKNIKELEPMALDKIKEPPNTP
jgi:hypothetical protein